MSVNVSERHQQLQGENGQLSVSALGTKALLVGLWLSPSLKIGGSAALI